MEKYNQINEWENKTLFKIYSVNNGINPIINIQIDNIDRFSFGEEDEEKIEKNNNNHIIESNIPMNYSFIHYEQINEKEIQIINDIENISDEGGVKIFGIFRRGDIELDTQLNKINESFDNKYNNPLQKEKEYEEKKIYEKIDIVDNKGKKYNLNKSEYNVSKIINKISSDKINVLLKKENNKTQIINIDDEKQNDDNKNADNQIDVDVKAKLIELTEKLERSENNIIEIKNTNEKLLEIINNFKNKNATIPQKNSPKAIKKRCYSPGINKLKISSNLEIDNINRGKIANYKKMKSSGKLNILIETNCNIKKRGYLDYNKVKEFWAMKKNSYTQIYTKEKEKQTITHRYNKKLKSKRSPMLRTTMFLTGTNKNFSNNNTLFELTNPISNFRKNDNPSLNTMRNERGKFHRPPHKLSPKQHPPFFESSSKFPINHIYTDTNRNISYKDEKLAEKGINGINLSSSNENSINQKLDKTECNIKETKNNNKSLNFKDFQVIFEEKPFYNEKIDDTLINQTYIRNNSYKNKFIEKSKNKKNFLKNKNNIPSLKNKINNNNNIYKKNNLKEAKDNGNIFKNINLMHENGHPKYNNNTNKYSEYTRQKYQYYFSKQNEVNYKKDNGKIINDDNKNVQIMIPFYLINRNEFLLNLINASNVKKFNIK